MSRRKPFHPQTGIAGQQAKYQIVVLIILTIVLSGLVNLLISLLLPLFVMNPACPFWLYEVIATILAIAIIGLWFIRLDDRNIGSWQQEIDWLAAYIVDEKGKTDHMKRDSYDVSQSADRFWRLRWKKDSLDGQGNRGEFKKKVVAEHFELLRFLLFEYLREYGNMSAPRGGLRGWKRFDVKKNTLEVGDFPLLIKENLYFKSLEKAQPKKLHFLKNCKIDFFDKGTCLMRIRWHRWGLPWMPVSGEMRLEWMGTLDFVDSRDKKYEMFSMRLDRPDQVTLHVLETRLAVVVRTGWTFLSSGFHDWAINFSNLLLENMDYYWWWDYLVERTVVDLDWKIGYISKKKQEPDITARLQRLDERLSRIERSIGQYDRNV